MEGQDQDEPRRSCRANFGVPPERYGDWASALPADLLHSTGIHPSTSQGARANVHPENVKDEAGDHLNREISRMEQKLRDNIETLTWMKRIRDGDGNQAAFQSEVETAVHGCPKKDPGEDGATGDAKGGGQRMARDFFGFAKDDEADSDDEENDDKRDDELDVVNPVVKIGVGNYKPTPTSTWKSPAPVVEKREPQPPSTPRPFPSLWKSTVPDPDKQDPFTPRVTAPPFVPRASPREVPQPPPQPSSSVDALVGALVQALQFQSQSTERFVARQSSSSNLPTFTGNPLDWPLFAHHYSQSTSDCRFSPSQNMARLEKALRGEARNTVRSLMILPDNTDAVMERLEQRYGRPDHIIRALVDIARRTPSPREGKLNSIVDFSNAIANLVATVKSLGVKSYLENPQLVQELVDKLPDILKLQWGMHSIAKGSDLEIFSNWVMDMAEAASRVTMPKFTFRDAKKDEHLYSVEESTAVASSSSELKSCVMCKKDDHELYACPEFKRKTVEQRWEVVKSKNNCFRCLKRGHSMRICRSKVNCRVENCVRRHHTLLHRPLQKKDNTPAKKPVDEINATLSIFSSAAILRIIVVKLYGPYGEMTVNALLDEGSTVTLMCSKIAKELGLSGSTDPIRINWTNGSYQKDSSSQMVDCWIGPYASNEKYKLKRTRTLDNLVLPPQREDLREIVKRFEHLQKTKFHVLSGERPLILIGQPHVHLTLARDVIEADEESPLMTKTRLGWVLHGPCTGVTGADSLFSCSHESDDDIIHHLVKESFALDSIGIVPAASSRSREDQEAEDKMKVVTRRVGERWETGLLWRKEPVKLPKSRDVAFHRLLSIERKLRKNDDIRKQYHEKIQHYVEKGYARKLTSEELAVPSDVEWYLPHFDRQHPNKPGKIRIVFDAASRANGVSLNDYLLTGADLLNSLPGILLQFRQRKIAFCGDITEMFHQVRIRKEDCPAQRILFRDSEDDDPSVYQLEVMMFGSVCSPYCAQYVKNANASEFQEEFPAAAAAIINKHYIDDYLQSMDTEEEALKIIQEVTEVHSRGGFEIGKWISNSNNLLEAVTGAVAKASKDLSEWSEIPTERALGLHWIPGEDMFTFRVNLSRAGKGIATGEAVPTKRAVLRLMMLVWDPLGFLGHYLIKVKILLQDLWKLKVGWDDEVPSTVERKWSLWIADLPKLAGVRIPRCYSEDASSSDDVQLHIFADSSELAGCAVAYLRVKLKSGEYAVIFVISKTRVSPVKPCSIPRLELQAALLAARLGKFILEQLDVTVHKVHFWTDSMTVLRWLRSEARKYHQFVAFRVGEIQEITEVGNWRYGPTKHNPADDGTREGKADLSGDARWWNGPLFLKMKEDCWPEETQCARGEKLEDISELRREFVCLSIHVPEFCLPDLSRFSLYLRVVRVTALTLKYLDRLRKGPQSSLLAVRKAESMLFRRSQWEDYPLEMQVLSEGGKLPTSSPLLQLSPMIDKDGCLRMKSRLAGADKEGLRQPIILHPKNGLTKLLIEHYHRIFAHQGEDTVRNELRQRFWIPNSRNKIRKVIRECRVCKLRKAKGQPPMMGSLPDFRMKPQPRAFTICGMDYFGPLEITVGRKREKRYGVLFTCLSTRAVHLEIAHSLSTDSCIMAIRRMISRRGQPSEMYSDNGTNLRGADKELRKALLELDQGKMSSELLAKGINWHFIPPSSPHMGGTWERLVRSVKSAMSVIMRCRAPREEILQTVFAEAEAIVNSRPLTDVPVDPESPYALTPSHFLIGVSSSNSPPGEFDEEELNLRKQWRKSQALADMFWRRWLKEYLPTLQRRKKWHAEVPALEIGDVVVVLDNSLKRNSWPLRVITQVFPGKDGTIRVVDVRTANGEYRRPVVKIGKLDLKTPDEQD